MYIIRQRINSQTIKKQKMKAGKLLIHKSAETLGERRATVAGEHVKPKVGKKKGSEAASVLGTQSHKHEEKKHKKHAKKK